MGKSLTSQYNGVHRVEHSSVNYADFAQRLLVLVMTGDAAVSYTHLTLPTKRIV